jgi:hypothetical protein
MPAIYQFDDVQYQLTDEDVETLGRALWGECGDAAPTDHYAAVAWAMLQRWLRWPGGKGLEHWPTFAAFMRAFSQPINPDWARGGKKAKAHPEYATEAMLQRREEITNTPWSQMPPTPRLAAELFAMGQLSNPVPEAVDFAAKALVKKKGLDGRTIGGNTFIAAADDPWKWSPGRVTVDTNVTEQDPNRPMRARVPVVLGLLALILLGGVKA